MTASTLLTNLPVERPFCRATDCLSFVCRERIGKTATLRKVLRNVAVERSIASKFVADALLRIEDKDGDVDAIAYGFHYRRKIGIAGDEDEAVGASLVCVAEHSGGNVHVRQLLCYAKHLDAPIVTLRFAGETWFAGGNEEFALLPIISFYYFNVWTAGKGIKVFGLPLGTAVVWGFIDYARSEVSYGGNCVVGVEKLGGERLKVEPLVCRATKLPVVKIASVYVNNRVFHLPSLKVQEPDLRPALRRLPEGWRVKNPVIGGTRNYTTFLVAA